MTKLNIEPQINKMENIIKIFYMGASYFVWQRYRDKTPTFITIGKQIHCATNLQ